MKLKWIGVKSTPEYFKVGERHNVPPKSGEPVPVSGSGFVTLDCFLRDAFDSFVLSFRQMLRRDVDVGEFLPIFQQKTKGVISIRWKRRKKGCRRRVRCFGHGGDVHDGLVDFSTVNRLTDGLVLQILNTRNCVQRQTLTRR
jgi:hypothetical protein